mmetsp:Transcript_155462/g.274525  ORF Transcript_155462/g.274525 Transcript_155462/m.274525 type:complete len:386 (+) Transcript_155462:71-1228(+)
MAAAADPGELAKTRPGVSAFEAAMEAQRAFMDKYGEQLEQLLQVGVYLVPVQEGQPESVGFMNQVVYSVGDLFNLYRTVLLRSPEAIPVEEPSPPLFAGRARASVESQSSQLVQLRRMYTLSAFALRTLRSVQVLIEMRAVQFAGDGARLLWCLRVEVLKLLLKLLLKSMMPFSFYIDEDALEEVEPPKTRRGPLAQRGDDAAAGADSALPLSSATTASEVQVYVGKRSGRTLGSLEAQAGGPLPIPSSRLADDRSCETWRMNIAEVLYHGRPLVHLLMLVRRGPRSWAAWWFALIVDRLASALLEAEVKPRRESRAAALEWAECRRRRNASWWAVARSPFFDRFLQSKAETVDHIIQRIPIINLFNFVELFLALQKFYFSTSGT